MDMGGHMAMSTESSEAEAIYRLMAWLSPSYPVGAFSYSHGLEYAVEAGFVHDAHSTIEWLEDVIRMGGARNDGVFFACAHRATSQNNWPGLRDAAQLAAAHAPSAELALETGAQGAAFIRATRDAWPCDALERLAHIWPGPYAYPVAVGAAAAGHGIDADRGLAAYLQAFAANLVSAAVRLVPLGQSDGQRIVAGLSPAILEMAVDLRDATLDDIGAASLMVDYCSMRHETQYTRLFRS